MISLLQEYLAINTSCPNPNYLAVVELFKKHAQEDGFEFNELILPSGNPLLIITLKGSCEELSALALNHHMDVVPADQNMWSFSPFSGTIHEGSLFGRGTQDCKSLGVIHYGALKQLKHQGLQLQRTIHLLIVPDEERGGFQGTKEFIEHPLFASLNIGYVLDEGLPSGNEKELLIKIDERTPIQIQVTSTGIQSHSSGLFHENCIHMLTHFLSDITTFHKEQQELAISKQSGDYISMQITSLTAHNNALNVIPSQAQATIDIRIPPSISSATGINLIDTMIKKHRAISYEILATSKERVKAITLNSIFYQSLAQAIVTYGLNPKPFTFEATTDARFYSNHGIETIGFTPFTNKPNLHGINENIIINDFLQGTSIVYTFLLTFCRIMNKSKEK